MHALNCNHAAAITSLEASGYLARHPVLALIAYLAVIVAPGLAARRCVRWHRHRTTAAAERKRVASERGDHPEHEPDPSPGDSGRLSSGTARETGPAASVTEGTSGAAPRADHAQPSRLDPQTLIPLGRELERWHRLATAEQELASVLAHLPATSWRIERNPIIAGHRVPFLVLGATGVFAIWAEISVPRYDEIPVAGAAATAIGQLLPRYRGAVQPGLCRVFAPPGQPQLFCRPDEARNQAWIIPGAATVIPWIQHFDPTDGLSPTDLSRLGELAQPTWLSSVPAMPNIPVSDE